MAVLNANYSVGIQERVVRIQPLMHCEGQRELRRVLPKNLLANSLLRINDEIRQELCDDRLLPR